MCVKDTVRGRRDGIYTIARKHCGRRGRPRYVSCIDVMFGGEGEVTVRGYWPGKVQVSWTCSLRFPIDAIGLCPGYDGTVADDGVCVRED